MKIEKAVIIGETENSYIVKCPFCNKEHYHGKATLGERVSHCFKKEDKGIYELVEAKKEEEKK